MRIFNQKGIALMAVIFLLVVIAFTGIIFISLSSSSATQAVNEARSNQAFYIAEAGMERARGYLAGKDASCPGGGCTCASINGNALFTNKAIGSGQFTIVTSTIGGQCTLTSTGGVPTIASGTTQRVVIYTAITTIQDGWAVGYNVNLGGGTNRPFMAHWDGNTWTNFTASAPNILSANLMEVSLANSSEGWAVSSQGHFIHYNGSVWSLNQTLAGNPTLNSIYMNTGSDGWAVGNTGMIVHWDGTVWTVSAYVAKNGATSVNLLGIYCMNSSFCWTVGNSIGNGLGQSSLFFWNGTTWAFSPSPAVNGASFRYVSCVDTTHCWAVGNSGGDIIFWNGVSWVFQDNGNPSLQGVDCVDLTHCWAAGRSGGIQYYNGTSWVAQATPTGQNLYFVSCVTAVDCWASGNAGELIHWNGTSWVNGTVGSVRINSLTQFRSGNSATSWKEVIQ